ncbi:MAG: glycosyltransferase [Thermoflavifilum sp.]|nr:glycosyltransferase [Thermoflavifilum sp.]MCL6514543.1 glycosyltransferase family 2 protein [Alicyclobacillus sp.]
MRIAVLIPCYNESLTIAKVVSDFRQALPDADIYVYDNNSTDGTDDIARKAGAIVRRETRQGKGNVVRRMFREVEADLFVLVDGDDTYPAEQVHRLLEPVARGEADMAIGDRLSNGSYFEQNKRPFHDLGNRLVRGLINRLFSTGLRDIMTGYRVMNRRFVKNFPIASEGFEIETEMTLHALDKRYTIVEVPIDYRDRPEGSHSKLDTFSDGWRVLVTIFSIFKSYRPMAFFGWAALVLLILGIAVGLPVVYEFIHWHYIRRLPSAVLAVGLVLLAMGSFGCGVILDTIVRLHRETYELLVLQREPQDR